MNANPQYVNDIKKLDTSNVISIYQKFYKSYSSSNSPDISR